MSLVRGASYVVRRARKINSVSPDGRRPIRGRYLQKSGKSSLSIPARASFGRLAGMTFFFLFLPLLFTGCEHSFKRADIEQTIQDVAKKEYDLDAFVEEMGETIGVQIRIKNIMGELVAEDQLLWKRMENMMMVMSRVAISMDRPPEFLLLDIVDEENPRVHLVFTRHVKDIQKLLSEVVSRTQYLDRLLMEFYIGEKRVVFDPYEMDIVRLMMMSVETLNDDGRGGQGFRMEEVDLPDFLARVAENKTRRIVRENKNAKDQFALRNVNAVYEHAANGLLKVRILMDLVALPRVDVSPDFLEKKLLPAIADETKTLFESYRYDGFSEIVVIEKNSGKLFSAMRK